MGALMKPPAFAYARPDSAEEALAILAEYGDEATILAGGQSLVPMMNFRLVRPELVVDITRVPEFCGISLTDRGIFVGATTRQAAVERAVEVRAAAPVLLEALQNVGHAAIRNRGTFGGSIAHADPAAELPVAALALDAQVTFVSKTGERTVPIDELFVSSFSTCRRPDEILTTVMVPKKRPSSQAAFAELARRHGDFAIVNVCVCVELDGDTVTGCRIAFGGVADVPWRCGPAESALCGQRIGSQTTIADVSAAVRSDLRPHSDFHATAEYRRELAAILLGRTLETIAGPKEKVA
jgi:CO/xanthine dehydrogenase FAD-binding subunit